jgi:hypothetical protein
MSPLFYAMPVKYFTEYNQASHVFWLCGLGMCVVSLNGLLYVVYVLIAGLCVGLVLVAVGVWSTARTPRLSTDALPPYLWQSPTAAEQVESIRHPVATVEVVGSTAASLKTRRSGSFDDATGTDGCSSIELSPLLDSYRNRPEEVSAPSDGDIELGVIGAGASVPEPGEDALIANLDSAASSRRKLMLAVVQQPNKDIYVGYSVGAKLG